MPALFSLLTIGDPSGSKATPKVVGMVVDLEANLVWLRIPPQADHRFQIKPIAGSAAKPITGSVSRLFKFDNRWDDPLGTYRVLYASCSRLGAFLEALGEYVNRNGP